MLPGLICSGWIMLLPVLDRLLTLAILSGSLPGTICRRSRRSGTTFTFNADTQGGGGTTYDAGNGINISASNFISVDSSDIAGSGLLELGSVLIFDAATVAGTGLDGSATTLSVDPLTELDATDLVSGSQRYISVSYFGCD